MEIYIAGPWVHRADMPEIAKRFEEKGHEVTHKWWEIDEIPHTGQTMPEFLREKAQEDLEGVINSDVLIVVNSAKSEGKAVEQGLALSSGIPIVVIGKLGGESKNVFHYLDVYTWVPDVMSAINELEAMEGR